MECVFCQIVAKQSPANILYEDDDVMVFPSIAPVKPVHLLIIPKQHVGEFLLVDNPALFGKLFSVAQQMVKREGIKDKGYRISINGGSAQMVPHMHIHLIAPVTKTAKL